MTFYAALIVSMLCTLALIPPLVRHANLIGAVDEPGERKVHLTAVPRIGGIAMITGALAPILFLMPFEQRYIAITAGVLVIFFFGVWDDRKNLSYKSKFLGQILAASVVVFVGDISIQYAPFTDGQLLPQPVAYGFTIFCLLAITNALNLADGLDGLAGGTTILSFGVIGVLCLNAHAPFVLLVAMAVVGGVLGFLRYNSHPASIFMGDAGSQFLGFILGIELILLTQSADPTLAGTLPLLVIGIPLLDTMTVMIKRMLAGRSPFSPDKNHLHHRLLGLGFNHYEVVVIMYSIQSLFIISAFVTSHSDDWLPFSLFLSYVVIIICALTWGEKRGFDFNSHGQFPLLGWLKSIKHLDSEHIRLRSNQVLPWFLMLILPTLTLNTLYLGSEQPHLGIDIILLAAILCLLFLGSLFSRTTFEWRDRITTYTFCALLAFLGYKRQDISEAGYLMEWIIVGIASIAVMVSIFFAKRDQFQTTPLDYLLILLALLVPYFAAANTELQHLSLDIVKFVALVYLFEFLISGELFQRFKGLSVALMLSAGMIATRSLVDI